MSETVHGQLRRLIAEGASPESATETVMSDLPIRWQDWARPFVLRRASGIEGEIVNGRMRRALLPDARMTVVASSGERPAPSSGGRRHQAVALTKLRETVYRLPDGQRVLWDDMTVDFIDLKIAQMRKHVGGLVDHLRILEAARKLCAEHGVTRIGDVNGWVEELQSALDTGEVRGGEAA